MGLDVEVKIAERFSLLTVDLKHVDFLGYFFLSVFVIVFDEAP